MNLDKDLYDLICKHAQNGENPSSIIAVLGAHITLLIQSFCIAPEGKLEIAQETLDCIVNEIRDNPNPMKEKLN